MKLFGELADLIDQTGIISFGINSLSQPPGANYADIYVMQPEFMQIFLNKEEKWKYFADASRENLKSGVVKVDGCCKEGKYIIGLKNPDSTYGVHIMIEIVAITEEATYETSKVQKPLSVTTKVVPVYGN